MKIFQITLLLLLLGLNILGEADEQVLIVGSEQNYPPFALGLTDETADGFTVELWRAVAAEAHLDSTIRVLPFHEILQEFKEKKIDVLINLAQSDERRQFVDFTVPHVVVNGAVFVRKNDRDKIRSEADLINKKIIVLNADLAHDYAISKGWTEQLILVDTAENGFRLLDSGQYDALILAKLTGKQTLEKLKITGVDVLPIKVGFSQKFSFAVQKGNAELLAKINEGLALTKVSGVYDKLYEKWFGIYEKEDLLPLIIKYLSLMIGLFLLIIIIGFYYRHKERKKTVMELQASERKLMMSNTDLLQFTNIAAHHLQEPTRRIVSFAQQLKNELKNMQSCNSDNVMFALKFIEESAIRQRALVRDIQLYLAATQQRGMIESIPVAEILNKIIVKHISLIQQTNTKIELGKLPSLQIDRPRLYDIFNILVENSLCYRRLGIAPYIRIYGKNHKQRVYYYIEDNGMGIPHEYRERVFLVFERLQVNNNQESTGIGLAIVRRILESCGGTISLEDTAGGGTTVVFDLPNDK